MKIQHKKKKVINQGQFVARVLYKYNQYWIYDNPIYKSKKYLKDFEEDSLDMKSLWFSIDDDTTYKSGYKLRQGDILKLGRSKI